MALGLKLNVICLTFGN